MAVSGDGPLPGYVSTKLYVPPLARPVNVTGSLHAANAPPSNEHSYIAPVLFELKSNVALALFVALGALLRRLLHR